MSYFVPSVNGKIRPDLVSNLIVWAVWVENVVENVNYLTEFEYYGDGISVAAVISTTKMK